MERDLKLNTEIWGTGISTHTLTWSVTEFFDNEMYIPKISTHTLTWSVTNREFYLYNTNTISTHTLTWSVTLKKSCNVATIEFQLTRSRGAWHGEKLWEFVAGINFNSHAHVERDYSGFATGTNYQDFNSHAHVERDISSLGLFKSSRNFNSHAHVERDNVFINF